MRSAIAGLSAGLGLVTGALVLGFPRRVGLTAAQALVSMPGDLVLPTATRQADRVAKFQAASELLWPLAEELVARYAELWKTPLELVYDVPNELQVAQTAPDQVEGSRGQASIAIQLVPGVDGTTAVHVRERYLGAGTIPVQTQMLRSAILFGRWVWDVRRAARKLNVPQGDQERKVSTK